MRLFFVLFLLIPVCSWAEVWQCADGLYTTTPNENCIEIYSSVSCGYDGNKYITPSAGFPNHVVEHCNASSEHHSPFVSFAEVEFLKQDLELAKAKDKKFTTPKQKTASEAGSNDVIESILSQYQDILGTYDGLLE